MLIFTASNVGSVMLGIFTADCMPVLMASKNGDVKAAVHAGWKGLAAGILQNTIKLFYEKFKVGAEDIVDYIAHHIHGCCYEVSTDFEKMFNVKLNNGRLNLSETAHNVFEEAGIKEININNLCNFCEQDMFFSYRKNRTEERMITVLVSD